MMIFCDSILYYLLHNTRGSDPSAVAEEREWDHNSSYGDVILWQILRRSTVFLLPWTIPPLHPTRRRSEQFLEGWLTGK